MKTIMTIVLSIALLVPQTPVFAFSADAVQTTDSVERNYGAGMRCIWRGKKAKYRCIP